MALLIRPNTGVAAMPPRDERVSLGRLRPMRGMWLSLVGMAVLLAAGATPAAAAGQLLPGGDFEGPLADFGMGHGQNNGTGSKNLEGTCWSYNTSWGVTFNGDYAGTVRSLDHPVSIGMLTSHAFVAGRAVRFKALSETSETGSGPAPADPTFLYVKVLDASNQELSSTAVTDENIIDLEHRDVSCEVGVGESRDMGFSSHEIDTSQWEGQSIKVRFAQNTSVIGHGWATLIDDVRVVKVDATASIKPATFFPVVDGYKDTLVVEGERNDAARVDIHIRAASDGALVREASIAMATGPYRWTWDGHGTNAASGPAALLPGGQYDVTVSLVDAASDSKTVEKRITLKLDFVEWRRTMREVNGRDFPLVARSRNAIVSVPRSAYSKGVFMASKKGLAGVVYSFKVPKSSVYGDMTVKVKGRSPNGHKAGVGIWNPELGGFRSLLNYDGGRTVGPRFKWWETKVPGQGRVKNGKARVTVIVAKGLGGKGNATFDIKKVKLILRVGTLKSPSAASVASTTRKAIAASLATKGADGRIVGELTDRPLKKFARAQAIAATEPDVAAAEAGPEDETPVAASGEDESVTAEPDEADPVIGG